jgi:hypothetical protein
MGNDGIDVGRLGFDHAYPPCAVTVFKLTMPRADEDVPSFAEPWDPADDRVCVGQLPFARRTQELRWRRVRVCRDRRGPQRTGHSLISGELRVSDEFDIQISDSWSGGRGGGSGVSAGG